MFNIKQFRNIISAIIIMAIVLTISGPVGYHSSYAQVNNTLRASCIGPDEKPILPCPPEGKCLGPDDRPITCPKPSPKTGGGGGT